MARHTPDPLAPNPHHTNSPLSTVAGEPGTWGLPSTEGTSGQQDAALVPPSPYPNDYGAGIFVGSGGDATAQAVPAMPAHLIRARVDQPSTFQVPHEATHRRYEAPLTIPIAQSAAGYTQIAPSRSGLHYIKLIACLLTLDAAGTLKFVQGADGGAGISSTLSPADMTGAMSLGTAAGFVLPPARIETPWMFTAPDLAFGLFTVTGKAAGFVTVCYSPYDA